MKWILSFIFVLLPNFAHATATVGSPAPDFSLQGADGKTYRLSDLKGKKIVVLEWFNNGCPYVHKHYDSGNMQRLQKKYAGGDISWFTIASNAAGKQGHLDMSNAGSVRTGMKMVSTALLLDAKSEVAREYEAKTTPHMFIIDKKGLVAYNGAIDSDDSAHPMKVADYVNDPGIKKYFEDALIDVRSGKPVPIASTQPYGCSVKY